MKAVRRQSFTAAIVSVIAWQTMAVLVQAATVVNVDEFGFGTVNGTTTIGQPAGGLGLQYTLSYVVFPGTVLLQNTLDGNQPSDIIVFTNTFLFFASDGREGIDAPADVFSFAALDTNAPIVTISETGQEGVNGASYTPGPGMPGYNPSLNPTYTFFSDIPEPSGALLTSLGAGWLFFARGRVVRGTIRKARQWLARPARW